MNQKSSMKTAMNTTTMRMLKPMLCNCMRNKPFTTKKLFQTYTLNQTSSTTSLMANCSNYLSCSSSSCSLMNIRHKRLARRLGKR